MNPRILCVIGTRPEAIKMAPVVLELRKTPGVECRVLATAQHREMLDSALSVFDIRPDIDLDLMRQGQSLSDLTARLITALDGALEEERPRVVLAQGDTATVFCAALACFYRRICFGHVEAGLRTGKRLYPFPEEMYRVLVARLADLHFAPTTRAGENLRRDGVPPDRIFITGNTGIDALMYAANRPGPPPTEIPEGARLVLVTLHRRENLGARLREVCRALRDLAEARRDILLLYPMHRNPRVRLPAQALLGGHPRIRLCEPLDYRAFVAAMVRSYLVISDSGGIQEEAPALGKPVLVLRDETERPEALEAGATLLVGPHADRIVAEATRLLDDPSAYARMAKPVFPYGDGAAAGKIVQAIVRHLREESCGGNGRGTS